MSWEDQSVPSDNIPKRRPPFSPPNTCEHERKDVQKWSNPVYCLKTIISTIIGYQFFIILLVCRSAWLQRNLLFLNKVRWPSLFVRIDRPEHFNFMGARNFYLTTRNNVKLGVWQIPPSSVVQAAEAQHEPIKYDLTGGHPVVVYVHGNSGTRASPHRCQLYRKLQELDCHVIAFDYRGYGDSTPMKPDEVGLVEDAVTVIRWALKNIKGCPLYVWGHSLGTGVSARAVTQLEIETLLVDGLILEAPFNNLADEINSHILTAPFRYMIGFQYFFVKPLTNLGITFTTDEYLANSEIPLLILHAEDDWVIPIKLGKRLYDYLLSYRKDTQENVRFVRFGSKHGYGHKYICNCLMLPRIIKSFMLEKLDEIPSKVE